MKINSPVGLTLSIIISVLAVADGILHLTLDWILFHGRIWGQPNLGAPPGPPAGAGGAPPGPPPGAPPQLPLPLNELFLLNFLGFVVLVAAFWFARRWWPRWISLMDAALAVMAIASTAGWFYVGEPNPNGLGYLSKVLELLLIVLAIGHGLRSRMGEAGRSPAAVA